jgi:putative redox protein
MSELIVSADSSAGMIAQVQTESFSFVIDESGMPAGVKTGPDPYDYILSALGACTVITLQMYAQRKQWPLERAEVRLQHGRTHTEDCANCEQQGAKLYQVTKRLFLSGNLSPEQRKRLTDISARCPVQKTLEAGLQITTILEN